MKEYAKGIYSVEVTREELKRYLKKVSGQPAVEEIILDLCLQDESPEIIATSADRDEVELRLNDEINVELVSGYAMPYLRLSIVVVEEYEVDEDGDFVSGTNYDFHAECTPEQVETFQKFAEV